MQKKNTTKKTTGSSNELESLKKEINEKYANIEENFWAIGSNLVKVNSITKNFRKWVGENTEMSVSFAYRLMKIVKRDRELKNNEKYQNAKPKISLFKLIKLLKYPADFMDFLDFEKQYEVPGGKTFNLFEMPREFFTEIVDHLFKMLNAQNSNNDEEQNEPLDKMVISNATGKLGKISKDLQNIHAALSEVESKDSSLEESITEIQNLHTQATLIADVTQKMLDVYNPQSKSASKAA